MKLYIDLYSIYIELKYLKRYFYKKNDEVVLFIDNKRVYDFLEEYINLESGAKYIRLNVNNQIISKYEKLSKRVLLYIKQLNVKVQFCYSDNIDVL